MSTVAEIEAALASLSQEQLEQLAAKIEAMRQRQTAADAMHRWLQTATGASDVPGTTTDQVMALTRGER